MPPDAIPELEDETTEELHDISLLSGSWWRRSNFRM